ncbi:MAG: hypothetical protein ABIY46_00845 [Gemmatimonadales bacterium]
MTNQPPVPGQDFVARVEHVLLARIEQVERENRRLRRFGIATLVGMAIMLGITLAVFVYSGSFGVGVPENIAARQFTIRDGKGTSRGTWGVAPDGTVRFVLSDLSGRPRVRMSLLPDGSSGVSLADSTDRKLLVIGALPDQSTSFVMSDRAGVPRAVLGMSGNGSANLVFADREGATKAGLGVDVRGLGSFTLADRGAATQAEADPEPAEEPSDTQPRASGNGGRKR